MISRLNDSLVRYLQQRLAALGGSPYTGSLPRCHSLSHSLLSLDCELAFAEEALEAPTRIMSRAFSGLFFDVGLGLGLWAWPGDAGVSGDAGDADGEHPAWKIRSANTWL